MHVDVNSKTWRNFLLLALSAFAQAACSTTPEFAATEPVAAEAKPAIVVIDSPRWDFRWAAEWSDAETGLSECLSRELAAVQNDYDLVPVDEFKRAVFPHLSAELAPDSPQYIKLALTRADVRDRLEANQIKYLIYIGGTTEVSHDWGDITCGFSYAGGGCAGLVVSNQVSDVSAIIMAIDASEPTTTVQSVYQGKNWLAVVGILPIWNRAPTRQAACESLAGKIIEEW